MSTPFHQRSHGFIWFFSFLVWFDSVQQQIQTASPDEQPALILLLDEPGLSLHALAQDDFLRYIDKLAKTHQVLYTTHSPFMIHSDRLGQVRAVEDQVKVARSFRKICPAPIRGQFSSASRLGMDDRPEHVHSERNLLVEGPSDMIYLKMVSSMLETVGRNGLRDDVTIVPTGGLDKVVTFVALLGANGLKLAVLHDYRGVPEQKLLDLLKQKMLSPKAVLNASQFRDLSKIGVDGPATDIEDLFAPEEYVEFFNKAFAKSLARKIRHGDLPAGDRMVHRSDRKTSDRKTDSASAQRRTQPLHHRVLCRFEPAVQDRRRNVEPIREAIRSCQRSLLAAKPETTE